ncbi:MAG: hypothetical protein ABFC38_11940 [Methanospirillum sp.]
MARVALVALAVASAFDLGSWLADRRVAAVAAVAAVLRSFCREAAAYCRARDDGRIDDAEAGEIAEAAGRFFADLEVAGPRRGGDLTFSIFVCSVPASSADTADGPYLEVLRQ